MRMDLNFNKLKIPMKIKINNSYDISEVQTPSTFDNKTTMTLCFLMRKSKKSYKNSL